MWCTSHYNHYVTSVLIYCSLCSGTNVVTKTTPAKAVDKLKMKVETSFKGLKAIVADRDGPFITTEVSGKLFHYTSMKNIHHWYVQDCRYQEHSVKLEKNCVPGKCH